LKFNSPTSLCASTGKDFMHAGCPLYVQAGLQQHQIAAPGCRLRKLLL